MTDVSDAGVPSGNAMMPDGRYSTFEYTRSAGAVVGSMESAFPADNVGMGAVASDNDARSVEGV